MFLGLLFQAIVLVAAESPVTQFSTDGRNIYRLASAELDGASDAREVVGSTYDGRICAFNARGKHLWDVSTAALSLTWPPAISTETGFARSWRHVPTAMFTRSIAKARSFGSDLEHLCGRSRQHELTADSCGSSRRNQPQGGCFSADGKRLGSNEWAVNGVIRMMRAGDFDGDGKDEVAVLPLRGQAKDLVFLDVPKLDTAKRADHFRIDTVERFHTGRPKDREQYRSGKRPWNAQACARPMAARQTWTATAPRN